MNIQRSVNKFENYSLDLFSYNGNYQYQKNIFFENLNRLHDSQKLLYIRSEPITALLTQDKKAMKKILSLVRRLPVSYEKKKVYEMLRKYAESGTPDRYYNIFPLKPEKVYGSLEDWHRITRNLIGFPFNWVKGIASCYLYDFDCVVIASASQYSYEELNMFLSFDSSFYHKGYWYFYIRQV